MKKNVSKRLPAGSPPIDLQLLRNSQIRRRRKLPNCIDLLIAHPAFLFGFQTGLKQLQAVLPSRFRFCFERNPLRMMHILLSCLTRILLIPKVGLSTMIVQRLLCVPGQVAGDHLRLGSCVLRRVFVQMCGEPPLNKVELVQNDSVRCVTVHPTKPFIAIGKRDKLTKTAHIFNVSSNGSHASCVNPGQMSGNLHAVNSVAFHKDAPVMATVGDDNALKVWLLSYNMTGTCMSSRHDHKKSVNTVTFHPDGSCIATGSDDGTAKLWGSNFDFTSWTCRATLEGLVNC